MIKVLDFLSQIFGLSSIFAIIGIIIITLGVTVIQTWMSIIGKNFYKREIAKYENFLIFLNLKVAPIVVIILSISYYIIYKLS